MSNKKDKPDESCECYGKSHNKKACPPIRNVTHPLRYYEFTQEELKALEECDKESFYYRCLPFSSLFAAMAYGGVKTGFLKPNARFGPYPKVTMAVIVGYFIGKLSYQQACAEKLMALPGSYIGQLLRDRKDGKMTPSKMTPQAPSMFGVNPSDIYSDAGPGSSLNMDTERPVFSEDTYRPPDRDDGVVLPSATPEVHRPSLSYDELRRRNRNEYSDARQDPYRTLDPNTAPPVTRARPPPPPATNKYGDVME